MAREGRLEPRNLQSLIPSLLFILFFFLVACTPPPTAPLPTVAVVAVLSLSTVTAVSGHSGQLSLNTDDARHNPRGTYTTADLSQPSFWLD